MLFCTNCGTPTGGEGKKFCTKCGAVLLADQPAHETQTALTTAPPPPGPEPAGRGGGASARRGGPVRAPAGFRPAGVPAGLRLSARIVATGAAGRTQLRLSGRIVADGAAGRTQLRLSSRL